MTDRQSQYESGTGVGFSSPQLIGLRMSFLKGWKKEGKKKSSPPVNPGRASDIGQPYLVKHNIHVGYNPSTGQIEGLPQPWIEWLSQANIGKLEQSTNPKAVIDALKYYAHSVKKGANEKFITTQADIDEDVKEIDREWPSQGSLGSSGGSRSSQEELLDEAANGNAVKNATKIIKKPPSSINTIFSKISPSKSCDEVSNELNHLKVSKNVNNVDSQPENNGNDEAIYVNITEVSKPAPAPSPQVRRRKQTQIAQLSDEEVMVKLWKIVNQKDPTEQYQMIKKIGSGASGTVFTAIDNDSKKKVAVKTMDLAQQPKKELIVTEIVVMKENQ